jgi:hypothetical protein
MFASVHLRRYLQNRPHLHLHLHRTYTYSNTAR